MVKKSAKVAKPLKQTEAERDRAYTRQNLIELLLGRGSALNSSKISPKDVINTAKELEAYIYGDN